MSKQLRKEENWQQILRSTEAIESAACINDWSTVNQLLSERKALIDDFFSEPFASQHRDQLIALQNDIEYIIESDKQTEQKGLQNRDIMAQQLKTIKTGKRARIAYEQ